MEGICFGFYALCWFWGTWCISRVVNMGPTSHIISTNISEESLKFTCTLLYLHIWTMAHGPKPNLMFPFAFELYPCVSWHLVGGRGGGVNATWLTFTTPSLKRRSRFLIRCTTIMDVKAKGTPKTAGGALGRDVSWHKKRRVHFVNNSDCSWNFVGSASVVWALVLRE